ncbi:MAG: aminotransferase class III-fold pyridoxal phosphate-dependent enzyme [Cyanobacteria bacterium P01_E01_bin.35]
MVISKNKNNSIQQEYINSLVESFGQKTVTSKQIAEQNRFVLADKSSLGFNFSPELKEVCYPIACDHSFGSRLWDVDGNEYIDILMGLGINLFGHNPNFVRKAIAEQLDKGMQISPQNSLAGEVAGLIADISGMERVTLSNTGTEAVMTALRIARAATNKPKIAIFTNSYHGHNDSTLVRARLTEYAKKAANRVIEGSNSWLQTLASPLQLLLKSNLNPTAVPAALGVSQNTAKDILVLDYGNPNSLDIIEANRQDLAAVIVEPIQSRCPELQPKKFLQGLRSISEKSGIILIFDEMVTGFRLLPGGAQEWFDIRADLVTYSKIMGGGMPISAIAGKAEYMARIDGGSWNYGDDSSPSVKTTFFAGTYCKHPLALAAAKAVLSEIKNRGNTLYQELNQYTSELVNQLNHYSDQENIPVKFTCFGSFFAIALSQSKISPTAINLLSYQLLDKGIHLRNGDKGGFLSTAHSKEDIIFIREAWQSSLKTLQQAKFI